MSGPIIGGRNSGISVRAICGQARRAAVAVLVGVAFSACTGSLLDTKLPVPTIYVLTPAEASPSIAAQLAPDVDLAVTRAQATPGLNTDRIAVLHEGRRLDYYLDALWGAALPQVVQAIVVGSLQKQNWFRSVTSEQARVNTNYWLELEVRDFQAEYASADTAPIVRVTVVGSLIRMKDRKLLGVFPSTVTVQAAENRLGVVIEAFESAARQASLAIGKEVSAAARSKAEKAPE